MKHTSLLVLSFLWFLVEVDCQQKLAYVSFMNETLPNNSYVDFGLVGSYYAGSNVLQCRNELDSCCSNAEGNLRGDWFFPSGERLPFPIGGDPYQSRRAQTVDINRVTATSPTGIYQCSIAYNASDPSSKLTLYVGLYIDGGILLLSIFYFIFDPIAYCILYRRY